MLSMGSPFCVIVVKCTTRVDIENTEYYGLRMQNRKRNEEVFVHVEPSPAISCIKLLRVCMLFFLLELRHQIEKEIRTTIRDGYKVR